MLTALVLALATAPAGAKGPPAPLTCSVPASGDHPAVELRWEADGRIRATVEREKGGKLECDVPIDAASFNGEGREAQLNVRLERPDCRGAASFEAGRLYWRGYAVWAGPDDDAPELTGFGHEAAACAVASTGGPEALEGAIASLGDADRCKHFAIHGSSGHGEPVDLAKGWPEGGVFKVHVVADGDPPNANSLLQVRSYRPGLRQTHPVYWPAKGELSTSISARGLFVPGETTRFRIEDERGGACTVDVVHPPNGQ